MSTATLHIEEKKTLVPQLRFQEFVGEWKNCSLNDITKYVKGFAFKSEDYQENGVRIVRVSDLSADRIKNDNEKVYINEEKSKEFEKYLLKAGNIVITTVGSKPEMLESAVGRGIYIHNDNEGLLNQNMLKFENIKNVDNGYIIGLINTKKYQHYMKSIARGNANQANITVVDLLQYQISIPTLPEQQKIASFLSAVDEKIQQLSRKKELLEQYKKGVMQQLFSGKLRFKDDNGEDYPDWEEKSFEDIFTFYTTNSLSREKLNYESGEVRNIHYGDIHTKFKTLFDINNELVPFINSDFDVSKIKSECYCQEGDLIIADASEDYADIGKSIEIINLQNKKVVAGLHTFLARPNKIKMYVGFSGYIVRSDDFRKQIMTIAQGSKVLSISTGRVGIIKMKIPKVEEQQKIANFLSSIDIKIENTNQQITKTQTFKKGLLQQMFI